MLMLRALLVAVLLSHVCFADTKDSRLTPGKLAQKAEVDVRWHLKNTWDVRNGKAEGFSITPDD